MTILCSCNKKRCPKWHEGIKSDVSLNERKPVFRNNKDADQPAHLHSLICAFVIHLLGSISKLATSEILNFYLVSVALQAAGDKDISCRTSDLQFSLVLQIL